MSQNIIQLKGTNPKSQKLFGGKKMIDKSQARNNML